MFLLMICVVTQTLSHSSCAHMLTVMKISRRISFLRKDSQSKRRTVLLLRGRGDISAGCRPVLISLVSMQDFNHLVCLNPAPPQAPPSHGNFLHSAAIFASPQSSYSRHPRPKPFLLSVLVSSVAAQLLFQLKVHILSRTVQIPWHVLAPPPSIEDDLCKLERVRYPRMHLVNGNALQVTYIT